MSQSIEHEISAALMKARRDASSLDRFPGRLPETLEQAYRVQAISRSVWPDRIVGWKVGGVPEPHRAVLGAAFISGPIFSKRSLTADRGSPAAMPVFAKGFAAIEAEFVLQLGENREEDRLFIGAEIASSPVVDINNIGPLAVICDFGNNNGLLVGQEIGNWLELSGRQILVKTIISGECVGETIVDDLPKRVSAAQDFLFDLAAREGLSLPSGTLISTGAITGVHGAKTGDRSVLEFGELGSLELELVPEQGAV